MKKTIPSKYLLLREELLRQLRCGTYPAGSRFPSEPELMTQYRLSRNTVRQAVGELENLGWLRRVRGSGSFVRDTAPESRRKIALLLDNLGSITHPISAEMIRGCDEMLTSRGFTLDLLAAPELPGELPRQLLDAYAGVLLGSGFALLPELQAAHTPLVLLKNPSPETREPSYQIDFRRAGELVARHLASGGRRNLALFGPGMRYPISAEFQAGVTAVCLEKGLRLMPRHRCELDYDDGAGAARAAAMLLDAPEPPDAIIAASDELALAALGTLRQHGVAVPETIAVTGCNDSMVAAWTQPSLTSLALPVRELGRRAAAALLERLDGNAPRSVTLQPELKIRNSSRNHAS